MWHTLKPHFGITVIRKTHCYLLDDDQNEILGDKWLETENNPTYGTSMASFWVLKGSQIAVQYGINIVRVQSRAKSFRMDRKALPNLISG